jgi:hypothetical protein
MDMGIAHLLEVVPLVHSNDVTTVRAVTGDDERFTSGPVITNLRLV